MWCVLISSLFVSGALGACNLYFNANEPGLFIKQSGSTQNIVPTQNNFVTIDNSSEVSAYCSEGFRGYSYSSQDAPLKEIIYSCSSTNTLMYKAPNSAFSSIVNNNGQLSCQSMSAYFQATMPSCQYYGLAYGFAIGNTSLVFADICYDLNTMQSRFVHYVAGPRTPVLDEEIALNPVNVTSSDVSVIFLKADQSYEESFLDAAVRNSIPNFGFTFYYIIADLIPSQSFGLFSNFAKQFGSPNWVAWWQSLKFGNWKMVENAIVSVSANATYDVYAGTSGILSYPLSGNCLITDQLIYKVRQYPRTVPLYVWSYVKPKGSDSDEGVVIVGVNSPFVKTGDSSQILCNDICDNIAWLSSIKSSRKIPSLGYVFCCKPNDVKNKLDNFPNLI